MEKFSFRSMKPLVALTLLASAGSAFAHHSFAMFDRDKTLTINGTIKNVEWTNPHVWIWVSVPNKDGVLEDWALESGGPSQMTRMGIKRTAFKPGEKISCDVHPMKDGRIGGQLVMATLADGSHIDVMKSVKAFAAGGQVAEDSAPAQ
ncbi:MAG: DUF6152 family protein [Steroidobacteraceae bacterium]